ncbi:UDP-galactopyranose mutase [Candidatus Scalindua japonica]|uniref:UDP-galactopyranose mutase n=1 Tax=Candidatus Scalindua japonica TaxID=1284222 RepID=A0A286TX14_9BACT|nr:UDP-galactopyranose mutase [Candidatus Scalindua japonica]GAX60429.1 UDP-galactopyranose mutase [Candidatus Scalindua japonica]
MNCDFLIVGAGFAGSVLAERLNSIGKKVILIDKRDHTGGNCCDYYDSSGVLVHKYGPHYFRTNFQDVKEYLSKFTSWRKHEYRIRASINGLLYPLPINRDTLNNFFKINLRTEKEAKEFLNSKRSPIKNPKNAEEQVLAFAGREIYDAFFKNYTTKQWGIHPRELDASVTARIPIRTNTDDRYVNDLFQAMPEDGYSKVFENLLKNIEVILTADFKRVKHRIKFKTLLYTGPIDEFFDYKYGRLPYRSLRFRFETHNKEFYQDWSQINYPNDYKYTRIVEIKHATGQIIPNTTIVKEYPCEKGSPFYPIPNPDNQKIYLRYKRAAEKLNNVYFIGRLAQYRYLNMDQIVKEALDLFKTLKNKYQL